jgi:hypothetical protein
MRLRTALTTAPLLCASTSTRTPPARLDARALLLVRRRAVDPVANVVVDEIFFVIVDFHHSAREMRCLDAHMDVTLAQSEKPGAAFVDDLDFNFIALTPEPVERLLNGFLAGLRCGLHNLHTYLVPPLAPLRLSGRSTADDAGAASGSASGRGARERSPRQTDIYFRFGRFLSAFAISFLRC